MVATEFYKLSDEKKFKAIEETAKQIDMPLFTVEKDWWVVQTLYIIFQMDCAKNLIFKGVTSLSKAWQADYKTMQNFMIHKESSDFTELIAIVKQAMDEYNNLKIQYP